MALNEHQRRWQAAALTVLLANAGNAAPYGRGPWIPADQAVEAVRRLTGGTVQAASGALRGLRSVGLAESCTTSEGSFWKATDAATRAHELETTDG
jgi:hypothetical protein